MKCLIADDDPRLRRILRSILEKPGLEFLEARNGSEALTLCQEHVPDLVIMDVEMSPLDGITAARAIRQQAPQIKVVILSQYDSSHFRQAAATAGALAYVLKDDLEGVLEVFSQIMS